MGVRSLNKVMLIGNLTRDPELKYTGSGTPVCSFAVATNRTWKDNDGETQEAVEYHNLVAWAKLAEIANQLLAKGMKVWIEGELRTRSWEDDNGTTHYKTEVRVDNLILLDGRGKRGVGSKGDGVENDGSEGSGGTSSGKSPEELLDELNETKKSKKSGAGKGGKAKKVSKKKDEDDHLDDLPF